MREYLKFFTDKSILSALIILVLMEMSLQAGCYRPFLKKKSYAANIQDLTEHVIANKKRLNPDILILGTSLAFEGISIPQLNRILQPTGLKAQSIAIRGAELIVQGLVLEKVLKHFTNVKYIIHVNEVEYPWLAKKHIEYYTLAMLAELDRIEAGKRMIADHYVFGPSEAIFLTFKLVSYRKDLGDFFIRADKRIKDVGRRLKHTITTPYFYDNTYRRSVALYNFQTIDECMQKTTTFAPIAAGSDRFHRNAVYKTCFLARHIKLGKIEKNEHTELYFHRLKNLYRRIRQHKIKIINVYPPLPHYLAAVNYEKRIRFWQKHYQHLLGQKQINLLHAIPKEKDAEYFFDLVHLNRAGMKLFTQKLATELLPLLTKKEQP